MSGRFTRTEIVADGIRKDVLVEGAGDACPRPGDTVHARFRDGSYWHGDWDGDAFEAKKEQDGGVVGWSPLNITLGDSPWPGLDIAFATMKRGERAVVILTDAVAKRYTVELLDFIRQAEAPPRSKRRSGTTCTRQSMA